MHPDWRLFSWPSLKALVSQFWQSVRPPWKLCLCGNNCMHTNTNLHCWMMPLLNMFAILAIFISFPVSSLSMSRLMSWASSRGRRLFYSAVYQISWAARYGAVSMVRFRLGHQCLCGGDTAGAAAHNPVAGRRHAADLGCDSRGGCLGCHRRCTAVPRPVTH